MLMISSFVGGVGSSKRSGGQKKCGVLAISVDESPFSRVRGWLCYSDGLFIMGCREQRDTDRFVLKINKIVIKDDVTV